MSTRHSNIGRNVFGVAVLACGVVTFAWHDWAPLRSFLNATTGPIFIYAIAAAQCVGGLAILFDRTAKVGAIVIGAVYLILSLLSVPQIITHPQIFASWGNFFYTFSLVIGAAIIVAKSSPAWEPKTVARIASILLGICAASFGIEQAEFLERTASLVPKWIPPSQMFWAVATCVPFALAAIALIANRYALLATRLFALMMLLFVVLVWIPILLSDPNNHGNWLETTETFAIAGSAWILADLLASLSPTAIKNASPVRS